MTTSSLINSDDVPGEYMSRKDVLIHPMPCARVRSTIHTTQVEMMLLDVFLEGLFEMDLRRVNSEEVRGVGHWALSLGTGLWAGHIRRLTVNASAGMSDSGSPAGAQQQQHLMATRVPSTAQAPSSWHSVSLNPLKLGSFQGFGGALWLALKGLLMTMTVFVHAVAAATAAPTTELPVGQIDHTIMRVLHEHVGLLLGTNHASVPVVAALSLR